jgi:hypothetical protein
MTRSREDLHYFQARAEQEIKRAQLADHPEAARAHYQLAGFYLDLVHNHSEASPGRPRRAETNEIDAAEHEKPASRAKAEDHGHSQGPVRPTTR